MAESRLSRRHIKQSRKQLYASLVGIVIVIFVGLNFGPYFIGIIGNLIDNITGKSRQTTTIVSDAELQAPLLDPVQAATSSDVISITGRAFYTDGEIELFVNNSSYKTVTLVDSQDFEIKGVKLSEGENILNVRMIREDKKSEFSQDYKISYVKDAPKLEISFPSDGASFSKADQEINVSGATDPENTVKINDFIAIVRSDGGFSYLFKLKEGENKIKIVAENPAGKNTEKEITAFYSP